MNFSEVLEAMKAGKKVRRTCWAHDGVLYIGTKEQYGHDLFLRVDQKIGGSFVGVHNVNTEEILAEDWEIVDEYAKAELKTYFECPRCNQISHFDAEFLLVDPKGRDIVECGHCRNKVEIVKKDPETKACCGGIITQTGANNFKTVISGEPHVFFYDDNGWESCGIYTPEEARKIMEKTIDECRKGTNIEKTWLKTYYDFASGCVITKTMRRKEK